MLFMSESKIAIAFDAMGGDNAPYEIVKGAVQASKDLGIKSYLVGSKEAIDEVLFKIKVKLNDANYDLEIVEADEEIDMGRRTLLKLYVKLRILV